MGKYFKAEWMYLKNTKMYWSYFIWIITSTLSTLLTIMLSNGEMYHEPTIFIISSLLKVSVDIANIVLPVFIVIVFVQSLTQVFTDGAYRNLFSLNISRTKWMLSKFFMYTGLYIATAAIIFLITITINGFIISHGVIKNATFEEFVMSILTVLLICVSIVLLHAIAAWFSILIRKTTPVIMIIIFGGIFIEILYTLMFLGLTIMSLGMQSGFYFPLPLPLYFLGIVSPAGIAGMMINISVTILFQVGYCVLFLYLASHKLNRSDY